MRKLLLLLFIPLLLYGQITRFGSKARIDTTSKPGVASKSYVDSVKSTITGADTTSRPGVSSKNYTDSTDLLRLKKSDSVGTNTYGPYYVTFKLLKDSAGAIRAATGGGGSDPLKINYTDTTNILGMRWREDSIASKKLTAADTASLRTDIGKKLNYSDTTSTVANQWRLALKLNISDTNSMLSTYSRKDTTLTHNTRLNSLESGKLAKQDTINMYNLLLAKRDRAGFSSSTDATLSLNNTTRVFKITPTSSTFEYYVNDLKRTRGTDSITIPNTTGQHYVYYNTNNVLSDTTVEWVINGKAAPVAVVYWDATNGQGVIFDERHSANRDREWHEWAHHTIGTRYQSGLACTFDSTLKTITDGSIFDEDFEHLITSSQTTMRMWYRMTGGTAMTFETSTKLGKTLTGILKYDANGTLTTVTQNRFVNAYIYATNDYTYPVAVVIGQNEQSSTANALNEALPTIPNLTNQEWKLLYRVTLKRNSASTFAIESANTTDYRTTSSLPGGNITSLPAGAVTFTPSDSIASTNVQGALIELDQEKVHKSDSTTFPGYVTRTRLVDSVANKLLKSDTTLFTTALRTDINKKLSISDSNSFPGYATRTMLATKGSGTLVASDTSALRTDITKKMAIADSNSLIGNKYATPKLVFDSTSAHNGRIRSLETKTYLTSTDTSALRTDITKKINISDSTSYPGYITRKNLQDSITNKLLRLDSNSYPGYTTKTQYNTKLNITDTSYFKMKVDSVLTTGYVPQARLRDSLVSAHNSANLTGNINISRFNSGTSASSSTYWRGDGTWATPSSSPSSGASIWTDTIDIVTPIGTNADSAAYLSGSTHAWAVEGRPIRFKSTTDSAYWRYAIIDTVKGDSIYIHGDKFSPTNGTFHLEYGDMTRLIPVTFSFTDYFGNYLVGASTSFDSLIYKHQASLFRWSYGTAHLVKMEVNCQVNSATAYLRAYRLPTYYSAGTGSAVFMNGTTFKLAASGLSANTGVFSIDPTRVGTGTTARYYNQVYYDDFIDFRVTPGTASSIQHMTVTLYFILE